MFFSDQNVSAFTLFVALKSRLVPNYDEEPKDHRGQLTSEDLQEVMKKARRLGSYLVAREIHEDICMEVSEKVVSEVRAYKWIESEKAGRNLWEDHPCEQSQLVAAGKQWVQDHWPSFKAAHACECAG